MSHWAEIDNTNTVIRVLVGDNNLPDEGEAFMNSLGGTWIKTSYNGNIRYNYAGAGYKYDEVNDAFIAPQPTCGHPELTLNTATYRWECDNAEHDIEL
jgi:hypothetical protein